MARWYIEVSFTAGFVLICPLVRSGQGGCVFVAGNLVGGIAYVLNAVLEIYFWIIFARAVLSWIRPNPFHPLVRLIYGLVDPLTYRISRVIPTRIGMIDIAPFILMICVMFLKQFVVKSLYDLGMRLG